ncbi:MAG: hypothetical protein P4L87_20130 [Formivibrio sp.]|nr:hypothetical protein [Formivibrio sp.]
MNREYLQNIFKEKKSAYPDFVKQVQKESATEQWGAGVLGAYHLAPYASELIGHQPGKMLKGPSTPAKNRYQYFLDKEGGIICSITYNKAIPAPDNWIHTDEFFEHDADHAISYKFSSIGGADLVADLERVTYATLERGQITKTYSLSDENEYVETDYQYQDGKVIKIEQKMWYEILYIRNFELEHDGDEVRIIERKADGHVKQIYPELT